MKTPYGIACCFALFLCGSCGHTLEETSTLQIVPSIQTRVAGLYFETGDQIGLTVVQASGNYIENSKLTYSGSVFAGDGLLWYNDRSAKSTLVAYYPYAQTGMPATFTVAADQRGGMQNSDLLAARKVDVTPSEAPVGLTFHHLLSQLKINVTNSSSSVVDRITLGGFVTTAAIDYTELSATVQSGAAAAEMIVFEATADQIYRAIVVPQQADLTVTVHTKDGESRSRTISEVTLTGGKSYDLSLTVTNADLNLTLSGEIEEWEPGGEIGDNTSTAALVYGGVSYRTAQIAGKRWMSENLRYRPEASVIGTGIWYPAQGEAQVSGYGLLYDYATATQGSSAKQGLCPTGWHLPDEAELTALAAELAVADSFLQVAGFWRAQTANDGYGSSTKGYLLGSALDSEGRCISLSYTSTTAPQLSTLSVSYGGSVRCVMN